MPSRIRCFSITPTDEIEVGLRRYSSEDSSSVPCGRHEGPYPGATVGGVHGLHAAQVIIGREIGTIDPDLDGDTTQRTILSNDPRWPTECPCGYVFSAEDAFRETRMRLYVRSDNGELVTIRKAPVGALYDSGTFRDVEGYQRNVDGQSIVCKTPAGEWLIDGPATNGGGWTRTGVLPDISVTPSIAIGNPQRLHGWLRNGWLEIDYP